MNLVRRVVPSQSPVGVKKLLYLSLVRSQISYCSQLWRPHLIKNIIQLEKVQRLATKYILNDYISDYKSRLVKLNLLPLMYFYEILDIIFLIKSLKTPTDNFNIDFVKFSPRGNNRLLQTSQCRTSTTRFFYFNRIVKLWNALPSNLINLDHSMSTIKRHLYDYMFKHFKENFVNTNFCTYHLVCPCRGCYPIPIYPHSFIS